MNVLKYKYSILHYRHSAVLGESLIVGVLIYFEHNNSLYFTHSNRLTRIKSVYENISEKSIKYYLKQIKSNISRLEKNLDDFFIADIKDSFDAFISNYILPSDGSSLQFSKIRTNFQYEKSNRQIIDYLVSTYLIEKKESRTNKEYALGRKFYQNIEKKLGVNLDPSLFQKNYKLKNKSGVEFRFDYAWQNKDWHLVKPLNFDLADAKNISEKAHRNIGLVIDLKEKAINESLKFDFLVGKPKNKELFKEYDHSIYLLESFENSNIIEEEEIFNYSHQAIDSIISHS
ncbi:hypothetical protein SAMN04487907_11144 [Zunongwangia mangrovi]|uniref:DUF3037 domain-containing protein n=1 Tax=Zunongwangia mangrovi TaxID=1334022 RepID=A0A1I1MU15_9FLAO|nr:hypothetical protein [Zunongwangia mangrovi]SFC88636.1 hypothetical protein SAMN04487907_11144 [Zunongwangia mangrovi]